MIQYHVPSSLGGTPIVNLGYLKKASAIGVHVRTLTPAFVGGRQLQANLIVHHMRRRINLDMQGSP